MNNNIKQMMRKRKRLYDKYERTKNASDLQKFKQYRNKITGEIRKSKKLKLINYRKIKGYWSWPKRLVEYAETIYQTNFNISYPTSFQAGSHFFR